MRALLLLVIASTLGAQTPDEWFERGMEHGRAERWEEARAAFLAGLRLAPRDPRFPTELGGVAYRQGDRSEARRRLRQALRLDPDSEYVRNFLGTLRLLDGDLEAALVVWNPIEKPRLASVETPPSLRLDPMLLDRALAFSPAMNLERADLVESEARLDLLGVVPQRRWELRPANEGEYELRLQALERRGLGPSPWLAVAGVAAGLPYQTARLDYWNAGGRAVNVRTLTRWDARKRRAAAEVSGPLTGEAKLRWRIFADARDEEWSAVSGDLGRFNLDSVRGGAGFAAVHSARVDWGADVAVSSRSLSNDLADGTGFATDFWLRWRALRLPARRFEATSESRVRVGRFDGRYAQAEERLRLDWRPFSGRRWRVEGEISGGATAGEAPFDELFHLGLDRDQDRRIRGLPGLDPDGRKGAAPVGERYWLTRSGVQRRLWRAGFVEASLGPFFDAGRTYDPRPGWSSPRTHLTAGVELRLDVAGVAGLSLVYGRDLRTGRDVWFASSGGF